MQTLLDSETNLFETYNTTTKLYSDQAFPSISSCTILTYTYYDSYGFNNVKTYVDDGYYTSYYNKVKGLATGNKTYIEDLDLWLHITIYYNDKYEVIQTIADNHLGGENRISNKYNFTGQITHSKTTHTSDYTSNSITLEYQYNYDHASRLLSTELHFNGDSMLISENHYNEIGELVEKNLHSEDWTNFLQSIDYRYNERGWLTKINEPDLSGTDGDLFGMQLHYDTKIGSLTSNEQYNGNISSMEWKVNGKTYQGYGFDYDGANRLLEAKYGTTTNGTNWTPYLHHSVENLQYDKNGNILSVDRKGQTGTSTYAYIDKLSYFYQGNQLLAVNDAANATSGVDFMDNGQTYAAGSKHEYFYDANGNISQDYNKGINNILYNHLNLPVEVNLNFNKSVNYMYDPSGIKLRKESFDNAQSIGSTDYVGEFIYSNNTLDYILFEEGRLVKDGSSYNFEYHLKDHLGNVRVAFEDDGSGGVSITQSQDYYPFGLTFNQSSTSSDNKYLYNGKEAQEETQWLDYGARMFDAQLGRWNVVDPLSEKYYSNSTYHFAGNNPVKFVDPNGMNYWVPVAGADGSINYVGEEGDNFFTFMEQYNLTEAQATEIFENSGYGIYLPESRKLSSNQNIEIAGNMQGLALQSDEVLKLDYSTSSAHDKINQVLFALDYSDLAQGWDFNDYFTNYENYYPDKRGSFGDSELMRGLANVGYNTINVEMRLSIPKNGKYPLFESYPDPPGSHDNYAFENRTTGKLNYRWAVRKNHPSSKSSIGIDIILNSESKVKIFEDYFGWSHSRHVTTWSF